MILHVVTQKDTDAFIQAIGKEDAILLVENGISLVDNTTFLDKLPQPIYALDNKGSGATEVVNYPASVKKISMPDWVDLCEAYQVSITW